MIKPRDVKDFVSPPTSRFQGEVTIQFGVVSIDRGQGDHWWSSLFCGRCFGILGHRSSCPRRHITKGWPSVTIATNRNGEVDLTTMQAGDLINFNLTFLEDGTVQK